MDLTWAFAGAAVGAAVGVFARGVAFRHAVPHGEPLRVGAPSPGRRWPVLESTSALVLALLLGSHPGHWSTLAFGFLGALGVVLAAVDLEVQRLPHRLTLPALPVLVGLLGVAAVADGSALGWAAFWRALLGGVVLAAGFYLLATLWRGQLGGGDVMLAGLLGIALGWLGWPVLVAGVALSYLSFSVVALVLLAARRVTLRSHLAFGPFLLTGALLAVVVL